MFSGKGEMFSDNGKKLSVGPINQVLPVSQAIMLSDRR